MINDYHISMVLLVIGLVFLAAAEKSARRFHQSLQTSSKNALALPFDRFLRVSRVVMVSTILVMIIGYWIRPYVPHQLRGLHLWLLVSCCSIYASVTYYQAIRRLLPLLGLRRVAAAAREWAAVQACLLFDSFSIVMAWLVANVLLALSSVNLLDPTGVIATFGSIARKWLPDFCMVIGTRVGHLLFPVYDNAPQFRFLILFGAVSLIICITPLLSGQKPNKFGCSGVK